VPKLQMTTREFESEANGLIRKLLKDNSSTSFTRSTGPISLICVKFKKNKTLSLVEVNTCDRLCLYSFCVPATL